MPRRPLNAAARRRLEARPTKSRRRFGIVVVGVIALGLISAWLLGRPTARQGAIRAESEARRAGSEAGGKWKEAMEAWESINATKDADARSFLGEARAALALSRGAKAEEALKQAAEKDPGDPEAALRLLDLYRLEDRPLEAIRVGEKAMGTVREGGRREVLKALTLALLADAPDGVARGTLRRFAEADEGDLDARLALLRRVEPAGARPGDSGGKERVGKLEEMFAKNPRHIGVREALALARADEGRDDRVRALLDGWPEDGRDARYLGLKGRWDLDHDHRADRAVEAFEEARVALPFDPRARSNLARALHAVGRDAEAREEAEAAVRLREILDPRRLGPRLDADLGRLDEPAARADLAALCESVGLTRLSKAWSAIRRTDGLEANWLR